jgi:hypothetical protein
MFEPKATAPHLDSTLCHEYCRSTRRCATVREVVKPRHADETMVRPDGAALAAQVRDTLGKMRQNPFAWPKILKFGVLVEPTAPWKV